MATCVASAEYDPDCDPYTEPYNGDQECYLDNDLPVPPKPEQTDSLRIVHFLFVEYV